jgi:hypothetical protein
MQKGFVLCFECGVYRCSSCKGELWPGLGQWPLYGTRWTMRIMSEPRCAGREHVVPFSCYLLLPGGRCPRGYGWRPPRGAFSTPIWRCLSVGLIAWPCPPFWGHQGPDLCILFGGVFIESQFAWNNCLNFSAAKILYHAGFVVQYLVWGWSWWSRVWVGGWVSGMEWSGYCIPS